MEPGTQIQPNQNDQATAPAPQVFVGDAQQVVTPTTAPVVQNVVPVQQPAAVPAPEYSQPAAVPAPTPEYSQPAPAVAQTSRSGLVKGIVVGVVLLVVFAGGFAANSGVVALSGANAKSAGKAMVAALVAGDSTKAYGLASSNLRSQQTASALMQSVGDVQTTKPEYSDQNIQVNGKTAVYVANVSNLPADDSGKTSGIFVVSLAKSGLNTWKVDDVSVQ